MTNVRRHAAASVCVITVTVDGGMLRLSIADDGVGLPDRFVGGMGNAVHLGARG